jgi:hypothetical protein
MRQDHISADRTPDQPRRHRIFIAAAITGQDRRLPIHFGVDQRHGPVRRRDSILSALHHEEGRFIHLVSGVEIWKVVLEQHRVSRGHEAREDDGGALEIADDPDLFWREVFAL